MGQIFGIGGQSMALSKKLRFNVFKRDSFTCQYCGKTPPSVILEVDHIQPVSKGGKDHQDNLLTACFDCNRGKSDGLLTDIPQTLQVKAEIIREREDQLKEYNKLLKKVRCREDKDLDEINLAFQSSYPDYHLTETFRNSIRTNFLPYINKYDLVNYMMKACSKSRDRNGVTKYFCGICWNVRREANGEK